MFLEILNYCAKCKKNKKLLWTHLMTTSTLNIVDNLFYPQEPHSDGMGTTGFFVLTQRTKTTVQGV